MGHPTSPFLDDHVRAGAGERVAIETPGATLTYAELTDLANRTGNALRDMGVEPEHRVGMLLPDGVDWAATFFGALRIGAVAVPLNTRLAPEQWAETLADSRAKVLVADAGLAKPLMDLSDRMPDLRVIVASSSLEQIRSMTAPDLVPEAVRDDDMAFWLYTSGPTGRPKAAVHVHGHLAACRHYGVNVLGATASDRVFATSKLFFAYALGNALLIPLYVGARTYLAPAWPDPALVATVMLSFSPTLFFSVPTFYARLVRADLPRETFNSLRCAVSAGERLPAELHAAWRERFGVEILDGLGSTETIHMVLSNRPGRSRPGSAGTPVPGTDVSLRDTTGREAPDGEPGVLHVRTPSASPYYWRRVEHSRRTFLGEWFRTGDVMTRDADGFYHHAGREDDCFKVAGQWVVPGDVEALMLTDPRVTDAGVVGAEDAGGLVKAFCFVAAHDGGADGLVDDLTWLAGVRLAPHQRPKRIVVVSELPRTATGKLQRFRLREMAEAQVEEGPAVPGTPSVGGVWGAISGPHTMTVHTVSIQVRWSESDPAGIAFYPRFFEWYDLGCAALFDSIGLPWPVIFPKYRIVGVPILECGSEFSSPVRYGDDVRVRSTVAWVRDKTFRIEHELSVGGRRCARGFEVRAWVARPETDGERLRARPIPPEVAAKLRG